MFIALFAYAFWKASKRALTTHRWFLKLALWSLPLPWIAIEMGWIVTEYGRQPWAIEGVLPTALGVSSVSSGQVLTSIGGFVLFYTALAIVDVWLMLNSPARDPTAWASGHTTPPSPRLTEDHAMFDYATLRVIWWALLGTLFIGFAIMDGFDFGGAALRKHSGATTTNARC